MKHLSTGKKKRIMNFTCVYTISELEIFFLGFQGRRSLVLFVYIFSF